jgi:hypothetical protein
MFSMSRRSIAVEQSPLINRESETSSAAANSLSSAICEGRSLHDAVSVTVYPIHSFFGLICSRLLLS